MYYEYAGRFFATLAAAESYRRMREWIASKRKGNRKNSSLTEYLKKQSKKLKFKEDETWTMTKTKEEDEKMLEDSIQGVKKDFVKIFTGLKPLRGMTHNNILYRDEFHGRITWNGNKQICQIPW